MRKEIEITIPYVKRGEELEKAVKISFISNRVLSDYNKIVEQFNGILNLHVEKKEKVEEMAWILTDKEVPIKDKRAKIAPLKERVVNIKKEIKAKDDKALFSDRFNIIKRILDDNGITDSDLLSYKFWNEKVEPSLVWTFLSQAAMKDISWDGKKKAI